MAPIGEVALPAEPTAPVTAPASGETPASEGAAASDEATEIREAETPEAIVVEDDTRGAAETPPENSEESLPAEAGEAVPSDHEGASRPRPAEGVVDMPEEPVVVAVNATADVAPASAVDAPTPTDAGAAPTTATAVDPSPLEDDGVASGVGTAEEDPGLSGETAPALSSAAGVAEASEGLPEAETPLAVRVRGLVKRFGDHGAVNGIDLTVPAGSFFGLVGPNGAGKTTTLSMIAGLLRPDAGEILIAGVDQRRDAKAAKRMLGVLPDRLRTFDRLTGRQLLHYYGLLRGLAPAVIDARVADLARAFDLTDALGRIVSDYSAGMTKKIMLAGALIHSPRVLVLDEPFEAVDPDAAEAILEILRTYVQHGGTVILSSHGMELVERVCSGVAILVRGDVLAEGTVEEVSAGGSLRDRFRELSGGGIEVGGLEWLHTFSD